MEEKTLKDWSEFKPTIDEIRKKYGFHEFPIGNDKTHIFNNTILFRGQQNSSWKLETTLERKTKENFSVLNYIQLATRSVNELESYLNAKWNVPDLVVTLKIKCSFFEVAIQRNRSRS